MVKHLVLVSNQEDGTLAKLASTHTDTHMRENTETEEVNKGGEGEEMYRGRERREAFNMYYHKLEDCSAEIRYYK